MGDYIFLMHNDVVADEEEWEPYIRGLQQLGCVQGGSAIGDGTCVRKAGAPASSSAHLAGFIRVSADSLEQAKSLLSGNPVFEAGGTVEIPELPRTD